MDNQKYGTPPLGSGYLEIRNGRSVLASFPKVPSVRLRSRVPNKGVSTALLGTESRRAQYASNSPSQVVIPGDSLWLACSSHSSLV